MTDAEGLRPFLAEGQGWLVRLRQQLSALGRSPASAALLDECAQHLRLLHDASASRGFAALPELTRLGDELLDRVRNGVAAWTEQTRQALLALLDAVSEELAQIAATGAEGPADRSALVHTLRTHGEKASSRTVRGGDPSVVIPSPPGVPTDGAAPPIGRLLVDRRATRPDDVTLAVMQQAEGDDRPLGEILVDHGAAAAHSVVDALQSQAEIRRSAADGRIRVDIEVLDGLARLVGELEDTRDGILRRIADLDDVEMGALAHRLDRLVDQLQQGVTRTRPAQA